MVLEGQMKLVGFCGPARVGKDDAVKSLLPFNFVRLAFADPLKKDLLPLFNMLGVDDPNDPEIKEKIRPLLVAWGSTARSIKPDFWVHRTLVNYEVSGQDCAVSDVRYVNEIRRILELGGKVYRVVRPGYGPANAEEERSFREIDFYYPGLPLLCNSGTLKEWGDKIVDEIC
jgi:hypothetical protein